jgi:ABC-2 type transport system ATP-binding protein/sodium transport system ATP-binding protein
MIHVHRLHKSFQSGSRTIHAVDDVSFEVPPAEVFGLLGPNGAGKTTTMRMILGLLRADSGFAAIDGFRSDVSPDEVKKRVGFVSANAGTYQWLTPREILTFFGDVYGLRLDVIRRRIEELSELLGIGAFLDQRSSTLSTGQRQRINLARALVHDPPVMLLDEPTLGLDVIGSQVIFDYIRMLCERNKAIILCTHSLDQAQRICDRFALLHQGRIVHSGTLAELQAQTGRDHLADMFVDLLRPPSGSLLLGDWEGDSSGSTAAP